MKIRITPTQALWVVIHPRKNSVLVDICFKTDLHGLELQFKGGLTAGEIHALYGDRKQAETAAKVLLQKRDRHE